MPPRGYGQYCGLARALELVGERWALLIVRDLLVGPRRFTDLRAGLPRIPTNVLSDRLKELEHAGVVQRRALPRPSAGVVYELTDYGSELDDVVKRLGLWGAQSLGPPRPDEIVTADSMVVALRSAFVPEAVRGEYITFELRVGDVVIHAYVDIDLLEVEPGGLPEADLVIESGPAIKDLLTGDLSPAEALERKLVVVKGDPHLLDRFVELFHIPLRQGAGQVA